ncbi:Uncharacterized membrane protein [Chitinophaga sp. CF118]|uniref:SRPBCC family protein n=1 Tax=Chitinophaga sp. CF118 TaxID=1884367 RepID=UPI0008E5B21D|nr:SRPBCC family protein [Chitinophaga sp. CF118]SFE85750.1 Uncharacterized membrane protein [Chitinophaga sp. CF118]
MSTYNGINGYDEPRATALYENSDLLNVSKPGRIASIVSGAMLTTSAINNINKHPFSSLFRLVTGGYLLYRGISGNCPISAAAGKKAGDSHSRAINIRKKLVINKTRNEIYSFWRDLENLPLFMKHLASVEQLDNNNSHWVVIGPSGIGSVEWNAEIVKDEPGRLIGWRSASGSEIVTAGRVNFREAFGGGTEIEVNITYRPPAGYVGTGLAWLLNSTFERMVQKDILSFKHFVETGVITI